MSEESPKYKAEPAVEDPQKPAAAEEPPADPPVSEAEKALSAKVAALETAVAEKDAALSEAKKTLDAQTHDFGVMKMGYEAAVTAYRKLAVGSNPIFSDELITGTTIAEVDASMKKVAGLAEGIKTKLEAELKATVIPAGAPERSGPDTSGMSPREKIKAGIQNK
jgi:flagellar biosynthesis/type III secretory pathway protein FliH